jgi:2-oxo-3-hexenedioate decarboxylase
VDRLSPALPPAEAAALAARILAAGDAASSIAPISDANPHFDLAAAYRVSDLILGRRIARGERPIGWKIGFTNRTIWDEYAVHAPIWGPMFATTVASLAKAPTVAIARLAEPRIEPEIAFRFARPPSPGMDEAALLSCIDAVAHGFEIVQSVFPAWRFSAADTIAAFALHGRYRHGEFVVIGAADHHHWLESLADFEITLFRDGSEIDRGRSQNVLGGPLSALRHFVDESQSFSLRRGIEAGDLVTTGTLTRAFPVSSGERWSTRLEGLPLGGIALSLI